MTSERTTHRGGGTRRTVQRAILAIDSAGTITKANLQARRAIGDGRTLENEPLGRALAQIMADGHPSPQRLLLRLPFDGEYHEVLLVLADHEEEPASQPPDEPAAAVVGAAAGERGNVADFIAHELRNNIAISLGLAQLLESNFDSIDPADRTSALRSIQAEGQHALLVLDGLLKLVESRRVEAPTASVPLHAILRRVISEHRRRYPHRSLIVSGDQPLFARGNSTWIHLAVSNLVSNAEKVTPKDQAIRLSARQEGEWALVLVMDQGQALEEPVYQKLWDIYTKGVPPGIHISGTGIGLSLCKELVSAMGGRVWAGPLPEGGSAFAISLRSASEGPT